MFRFLYIIFFLAAGFQSNFAQSPYFREVANHFDFEKNRIQCLEQDGKGYVWIGTEEGIYKSNGLTHKKIGGSDSLINKNITAIFSDKNDNMWVGTNDGDIACIDIVGHRIIEHYTNQIQARISCINQTSNQTIIAGTYGEGIMLINSGSLKKVTTEHGISDNYIYTLSVAENNKIWAGTDDGINILDLEGGNINIETLSVSEGLPDFIVKKIEMGLDGKVWIGMHDKGICFMDTKTGAIIIPDILKNWSFGQVKDLVLFPDRIWIATETSGIIDYNFNLQKISNYSEFNGMDLNKIAQFMIDAETNIWALSKLNILLSFGPKLEFIDKIKDLNIVDVRSIIVDKENHLWFADKNGVHRYDPFSNQTEGHLKSFHFTQPGKQIQYMCLYEDPYDFLWIGTFGDGIIRLDKKSFEYTIINEQNGFNNGNVLSINGTNEKIWFATLAGVSSCEITPKLKNIRFVPEFKTFRKEAGIGNNFIYHVYPDKNDNIWLATDGTGIVRFAENKFSKTMESAGFQHKIVYSVTGDHMGNIWMNVANEGVYKYNGEDFIKYFNDPEHQNLSFSGILVNKENELVIAYDEGIDILNIVSGDIIHYEDNAGLAESNPNLNTITTDALGNVWIGTSNGIVKYTSFQASWTKPHSIIDEVSVYLEKIDHLKNNSFSYNQNHFTFGFAGLWYQHPDKVEFQVKLEGHDLNWIDTKNNNVVYANLKPGHYQFLVKSALYGNFKNAEIASYPFVIRKPLWSQNWFYIAVVLIIAVFIFAYIKFRENNLRKKQEALREKIRFQFENLKSQINPHFLFNSFSTLIALIESNTDDAVEYTQELSNLFRNILEYKDQDVIPLHTELQVVENYIKLQKKRFGENLQINIHEIPYFNDLLIPPLTIQLLIENAIKHNIVSKNKPLQIDIFTDVEESYLYIKNNLQTKDGDSDSTGIGINNIISRYKILTDKKVEIIKSDTEFIVGLPFILTS